MPRSSLPNAFVHRASDGRVMCDLLESCEQYMAKGRVLMQRSWVQGLLPAQVRLAVQNRQGWAQVPAETVQPGNLIVVLPGDCVPVDGTVVEGTTSLNEAALTGEPMPVTVTSGAASYCCSYPAAYLSSP